MVSVFSKNQHLESVVETIFFNVVRRMSRSPTGV